MILRTFKSNQPFNFIVFAILGLLFWVKGFLQPEVYPFFLNENASFLYQPLNSCIGRSGFFSVLLSAILIILLAFNVQFINQQFAFIKIRTMLPMPIFLFLAGGFVGLHTLHPVYFALFFILLAISRLLRIFENPNPNAAVFDSGFFIGIASLFYFSAIVLLPAFIIGTAILQRVTKIRLFIIQLIGVLLPFIFAFSYTFLTDGFLEFLKVLESQIITPNNHFKSNVPLHIFLGFNILLTFLGSIKIIQQYDTKKVSTRKYFMVFFVIFMFSMLGFIFIPATSHEMLLIMAIPVCYLVSNFLVFMKSRFWGELIVLVFLGMVIYMQFVAFLHG